MAKPFLILAIAALAGAFALRAPAQDPGPAAPPAHEARALAANEKGVAHFEKKELDLAVACFEEARAADPKVPVFTKNLARALHARGVKRADEGSLKEALEDLSRGADLDSEDPGIRVSEATVHGRLGDNDRRRRILEKVLEEHPQDARGFEALGRLEYEEERLEEALALLETAAKLDPERAKGFAAFLEKVRREAGVEGRYFREERGIFTVKYDDQAFRDVSQQVLDLLDRHYTRLGTDLGHWPKRRVNVVLYTREDFDQATGAHRWTGGLFDGTKIRLPVRNFRTEARQLEATIAHELSHFFVRSLAPRCPLWLDEGIAQLSEGKRAAEVRGPLAAARREGRFVAVADLPANWASIKDDAVVRVHYATALSFTDHLVRVYGWSAVAHLLKELGASADWRPAFEKAFGRPLAEIEADWLVDV